MLSGLAIDVILLDVAQLACKKSQPPIASPYHPILADRNQPTRVVGAHVTCI